MYDDAFSSQQYELITPGRLRLPSAKVVACDPFFCSLAVPFARVVRPGDYEVQLCRAESRGFGKRIALARILFQPEAKAVEYEKAIQEGADSNQYFVESRLGCFMDELTRQKFVQVMAHFYKAAPDGNYYNDKLASEFKKSALYPDDPDDGGAWAVHYLPDSQLNVVMFASGLGDGAYESFWGLSREKEIVSLVTDFRILSQASPS
jgi:hypothetical protein